MRFMKNTGILEKLQCGTLYGSMGDHWSFFEKNAGEAATFTGERYQNILQGFLWHHVQDMDLDNIWF